MQVVREQKILEVTNFDLVLKITFVVLLEYLLQVWYWQQLFKSGQKDGHKLLDPLVIDGAVVGRKNLLKKSYLNYRFIYLMRSIDYRLYI